MRVIWRQTAAATNTASEMSRKRCRQEAWVASSSPSALIASGVSGSIVTSERKTMSGSTEKRKPPIVLHGVGVQAGASACRRRTGKGNRRDATVAAHWRMRPAARGPANQFSACRENWIDSSHARGTGNSCATTTTATMSIYTTIRCDAREAPRQNRRCACECATHPSATALNRSHDVVTSTSVPACPPAAPARRDGATWRSRDRGWRA